MLARPRPGSTLSAHCLGMLARRAVVALLVPTMVFLALPAITASAAPPIYSAVTFYQNDSVPGAAIGQEADAPTALLLISSLGSTFNNPGYVFVEWSTTFNNASGSATYTDGQIFDFASKVSLYAQWAPVPASTLTFAGNGATGSISSVTGDDGNSVTLPTGADLTYPGYTFAGWNTAPGGEGISYSVGGTITLTTSLSLYAQWTETNYVVDFLPNGGTVSPTTTSFNVDTGTVALPTPTYPGYTFNGWFTAASGGTLVGLGGSSTVLAASTDLYAQWTVIVVAPVQVLNSTISFADNGGVGSVADVSGANGTSVTLPGGIGMSYVGKSFASWNTAANGSGTPYNVDAPLKLDSSFTLFAQWDTLLPSKATSVLLGAVGTFSAKSSKLSTALKVQVKRLASLVKTGGYARVTLYGYSTDSGTAPQKLSISRSRANAVAGYLRTELTAQHVKGVSIDAAGEGSIKGKVSAVYRRVEVFVTSH
jgi:uncharacterized repeat protein (TIGR02543 family)